MSKTLTGLAIVALALGIGFAGCGDDDEDTTSSAGANTETTTTQSKGGTQVVKISETEYKLDPSEVSVKPGEVTFEAVNDGSIVHNLEVEGEGLEDVTDDLEPGQSADLTVDLQAGQTYEMYCSIADHAEQGMEGEITVEDS